MTNAHQSVIAAATALAPLLALLPEARQARAKSIVAAGLNPPTLGRDVPPFGVGWVEVDQALLDEARAAGCLREVAESHATDRGPATVRLAIERGLPLARPWGVVTAVDRLWLAVGLLTGTEPWRAEIEAQIAHGLAEACL